MPVFHNGENIAGVDRLAIGMIGMARHGSDEVSTNQLPISKRVCSAAARATAALFTTFIEEPQGEGMEESGVPTRSVDLGTQTRSGADTAQQPELWSGNVNNGPAESRAWRQL